MKVGMSVVLCRPSDWWPQATRLPFFPHGFLGQRRRGLEAVAVGESFPSHLGEATALRQQLNRGELHDAFIAVQIGRVQRSSIWNDWGCGKRERGLPLDSRWKRVAILAGFPMEGDRNSRAM